MSEMSEDNNYRFQRRSTAPNFRLPGMNDEPGMDRPILNAGIEPMTLRVFHRDAVVEFNMLLPRKSHTVYREFLFYSHSASECSMFPANLQGTGILVLKWNTSASTLFMLKRQLVPCFKVCSMVRVPIPKSVYERESHCTYTLNYLGVLARMWVPGPSEYNEPYYPSLAGDEEKVKKD